MKTIQLALCFFISFSKRQKLEEAIKGINGLIERLGKLVVFYSNRMELASGINEYNTYSNDMRKCLDLMTQYEERIKIIKSRL